MVTTASVPDGKGEVGTPEDSLYAVLLVKETHPLPEYLPHFAFPLGRCCKPSCFIDPIGRIDFFFFNIYELAGCGRMNEMVKTLSFGGNICKSFM